MAESTPLTGVTEVPMRWYVDGEEYDLTGFLEKHPGGPDFLLWSKNRDISIPVHTYHKDPERTVLPLLKKYKVEKSENGLKSKIGIPHFLLPAEFEAKDNIPTYNFDYKDPKLFLNVARKKILDKDVQKKIRGLDKLFDQCAAGFVVAYFALLITWLMGITPWYVAVPLFTLIRTSMAGCGHYYVHRKKPFWGDVLFDVNYVGMAFTAQDGHVLIHHAYTQSDADVKRGFFGGMMGIPRILRIPVHTLHKLGHVVTGMLIRGVEVEFEQDNDEHQGAAILTRKLLKNRVPFNWPFWVLHLWLRVELVAALCCGCGWSWLAQFTCTLWFNTLMIVSSHDFTEAMEPECKDWGRYQLLNAHDMSLTGCKWIDCFLSAGLAPHRAHHIFPYQKSGFSNYYSNQFLKEAAKECGLPWCAERGYFSDIFPFVFQQYIWAPVSDPVTRKAKYATFLDEHIAFDCYKYCVGYVWCGLLGIGSI